MIVAILGGGGFIGSTIADKLLEDGHTIRIFERPRVIPYRSFSLSERVDWIVGDFSSCNDITSAISGVDIVLHLISTTLPKGSNDDPIYDIQSNLVASVQLLNAMVACKVPRIIYISSAGTVYGDSAYLPIDETHPTEPRVSYGITKLAIEKYILLYKKIHSVDAIILRVSNPYGERQRVETAQGAVGVFLSRAVNDEPIEIWGDGSVVRDYLHVSDVAEAFKSAIQYSGPFSIFNVASGIGSSLNDVINEIEEILCKSVTRIYKPGRMIDVSVNVLSIERAKKELKWSPQVDIKGGIKRTAKWLVDTSR